MNIDFKNKTVLITGASRGIGRATARMFAESGAKVIIHYNKNKMKAVELLNEMPGEGHFVVQADISIPGDVKKMTDEVFSKVGRVDILVNNAGIYEEIDILLLNFDEWQDSWKRTINTNLTGLANLTFLISKSMAKKGGGKIINVSSRGAFRGEPTAPAYGAAKAGLNAFGQSFAKALAKNNIFVYTVAPGWVDTDMTKTEMHTPRGGNIKQQSPMNRIAKPEEIAQAIFYLASDGTDFMSGCILDINGASYLRS